MAEGLTRNELLTESRKILNNIGKRLERMAGAGIPSPALHNYLELQKRITGDEEFNIYSLRSALKGLNDEKLLSAYRDLRYIGNLKSTYQKGANKYYSLIAPVLEKYDNEWSEKQKENFRTVYGKLLELQASGEAFKYTFFDLAEQAIDTEDTNEIPVKVMELLIDLQKKHADDNGEVTVDEFLSSLREVR